MLPQVPADGAAQGTASLLLQKPLLSCVPHRYARDVSRLCHLTPGAYRIVPSTYLPGAEGTFTVTVATRVDRWGCRGLRPPCPSRPCVSRLPTRPAPSCLGRGRRLPHVPDASLPVTLRGEGRRAKHLSPGRKRDPEGDRAVLCHRRAIHSQEMLGQPLQEVRGAGGAHPAPPSRAVLVDVGTLTRLSPERPWAELPRGWGAVAVSVGAEGGRASPPSAAATTQTPPSPLSQASFMAVMKT